MLIDPKELRIRAAHYRQVASACAFRSIADRRFTALASGLDRQADVLELLMKHIVPDEDDLV